MNDSPSEHHPEDATDMATYIRQNVMKTMFVDANSVSLWNHENYTSIPSTTNDKRILYGFIRIIHRAVFEQGVDRIIVVDDEFSFSSKNKLVDGYKQTKFLPFSINRELVDLQKFCNMVGIPYLRVPGLDCLDVLATLGRLASENGETVYLVSSCDFLRQVNKVKVVAPYFVMHEGDYFAGFANDEGEAHPIDLYILTGSTEYGIHGVYNDLNIFLTRCHEIAKISLALFLADRCLSDAVADKINLVRQLVTINAHLNLSEDALEELNRSLHIKADRIMAAAGHFSLDAFLVKEFPNGTAYPPTKNDKRQQYYDSMIVGSGQYSLWSMRRLAQYDQSILIKEIQMRGLRYANRDYKDALRLALGRSLQIDIDPARIKTEFTLCLTEPIPNDCDYCPSEDEPKERVTYIYGLYDPREPDIYRYIGKANDPLKRLQQHIKDACQLCVPKDNWIYSLLRMGVSPEIKVIEEVRYRYDFEWGDREIFHINEAAKLGRIYNSAAGGEDRFSSSPWRVAGTELDFRYRHWKKNPTPQNQDGLWRAQLYIIKWRIRLDGGSFCKYCFSYIPGLAASRRTYNDLLPYPPLIGRRDLWDKEALKHSPRCCWWKTGVVGQQEESRS